MPQLTDLFDALLVWGEGRGGAATGPGTGVAVLADRSALAPAVASGLVTDRTVVLVPEGDGAATDGAVTYTGELTESGSEATVCDEFYLFTQDYSTSAYLSVIGPTLVRVFGEEDLAAFVADADRARADGVFPDFLLAPAARLADLPGLGGDASGDGPRRRVFVRPDGTVTTSPTGSPLGTVGDGLDALEGRWQALNDAAAAPCAVCLGDAVPATVRDRALLDRPWLRGYLDAVDALRDLTVRGVTGARVSGWGHTLVPGLHAATPDTAGPPRTTGTAGASGAPGASGVVLAWTAQEAFLRDPARRRTFRFNRDAAAAVEAVLVTGSVAAAAEWVPATSAAQAADQLAAVGIAAAPRPLAVGA
ncbi:daptide biosynthesis RiPP recognition protein [uncultured Cellulomonas sp.]|uniref:daptide biosynthesis RiPP recognition protein n=1 Tax=uncultured Cellulomonas sp. TaxID=189682 RepID=UPI00261FE5B6|nr:daptide biosynthesis RiPP recognition protein [uncultured Cellulomonas sp.]